MLVVAAVGGWRYWQHLERTRAEAAAARYQEALRLDQDGKGEEAAQVLRALSTDSAAGYRLLARFRLAAETGQRDAAEGAKAYRRARRRRHVAAPCCRISRACAPRCCASTPTEAAAAQPALERIATPTNAWRHTAREMLGLAALKRGDYDARRPLVRPDRGRPRNAAVAAQPARDLQRRSSAPDRRKRPNSAPRREP